MIATFDDLLRTTRTPEYWDDLSCADEADTWEIAVGLASGDWTPEATALHAEIPNRYYDDRAYAGMVAEARLLSEQFPAVPVTVAEVFGYPDFSDNSFNATHYREVRRWLAGVEVTVPDDTKQQY